MLINVRAGTRVVSGSCLIVAYQEGLVKRWGKETLSLNLRIVITATKDLIIQTLLEWVVG